MAVVTSAVAAGVGAVATVGSAVYGGIQANKAKKKAESQEAYARRLQEEAIAEFDNLKSKIPSVSERLYQLQRFKQVGELTPELEEAITQEETALKQILVNPEYRKAQEDSLAKYQEIIDAKGLTPDVKAKLDQIQREVNAANKARQQAILQSAAQRGTLSGGQTLAAQLLAQQEEAQRASQTGTDVKALAYKGALDALAQRAELGKGLEQTEYGQQKDVASAQDIINQFNVRQQTDTQRANIDRKNIAQEQNLAQRQRIADLNVGLSQEEARNQAAAREAKFKDELAVAQGKAGQLGQQAGQQAGFAQQSQSAASQAQQGMLGGIAQAGTGLASYGTKNLMKMYNPELVDKETKKDNV